MSKKTTEAEKLAAAPARLAANARRHDSGCLMWTKATDRNGYGKFWYMGKPTRAHRVAYQLAHGPVPSNMVVMHRCDNPPCIEASHLTTGSAVDNRADCVAKRRQSHGETNGSSRLSQASVNEIRACNLSASQCSRKYGVKAWSVYRVRRGITWRASAEETL
jgi:hypothetical protein